jgi:hypothetical protein
MKLVVFSSDDLRFVHPSLPLCSGSGTRVAALERCLEFGFVRSKSCDPIEDWIIPSPSGQDTS